MAWEEAFLLFLQNNVRTDFFDPVMQFFSFLGDAGWFWILISIVLILYKPTRPIGIIAFVSLAVSAGICNGLLKNIINRTRPYVAIETLELITKMPHDSSFPSGHSNASFAVACAITWCLSKKKKWIGVILIVIASMVAFSRLYVGVHYPTDVIAGIILGTVTSIFVYLLLKNKIMKPSEDTRFLEKRG